MTLVAYDASWPGRYEEERRRLAGMLPGAHIEHIGSTAVPGMAAAPVIDVMALVGDLDGPISVLVERGRYEFPADLNAGLSGRRWLYRQPFNLFLVDSDELLSQELRFRDALRGDAALAASYEELKRAGADWAAKDEFARGVVGE